MRLNFVVVPGVFGNVVDVSSHRSPRAYARAFALVTAVRSLIVRPINTA